MLLALVAAMLVQPVRISRLYTLRMSGFYFKPTPMIMGQTIKVSRDLSLRSYVYLDDRGNWHQGWMSEVKF